MSHYLAVSLLGLTSGAAVEVVALAWNVKSPNWKSWRWWAAWFAVMVCAQVCFFLGVAAR